jgi:hypothetical protein
MGTGLDEHFAPLKDSRKNTWLQLHELRDILIIAICATLTGCDNFEEMALFAEAKITWFKKF